MSKEIFISYQNESEKAALDIVDFLERNGRTCWIAKRDVEDGYASEIVDAISKCRIFVLLITEAACKSKHIENEVEQAYRYMQDNSVIILPVMLENCELSKALSYYIARIQHLNAYDTSLFDAECEILKRINKHLGGSIPTAVGKVATVYTDERVISNFMTPNTKKEQQRVANRYYDVDDRYEKKRLMLEGKLLLPYENEYLNNRLLRGKEHLNGLITSCMYAHGVMDKFNLSQFDHIIGLCYNEKATFEANYDFKTDNCEFFTQDVEAPDFDEKLTSYMEKFGIDKFDFIDISMGFLDWKNPFKVIKLLKRFMKPDCLIYVKDIDDGSLIAFPDEKDLFRKFFTFYELDPIAGYRQSGRRIFSYFKKIGAKKIHVMKKGIDTADMDYDQKDMLFHTYFGFIPNDFKIEYNAHPDNEVYREIIDWCNLYYDDLEEEFMNDDFYFNSGYHIITVEM